MRKVLTCSMVLALMAMATPVSANVVGEVGTVSRSVHLEHRLARVQHRLDQLSANNNRLHRLIERIQRRTIPKPTPTPTSHTSSTSSAPYSGGFVSDAEAASLLRNAGFPESAISTMIYYMHRESSGDPSATNSSSGACGLWQMYPCPGPSAYDPQTNANMAYAKYQGAGFAPWGG